jgi:hypothetical protein
MSGTENNKRDGFFIVGIVLFAFTIVATFVVPYFFLIMPLSLLIASIFVVVCKKKTSSKILWILSPIGLLALLIFIGYQLNKMEPETLLIPNDFRGSFVVYFEESCGTDAEYQNGRRVYRIPQDGILITKFKRDSGIIDDEFYLIDAENNKTLLPKLDTRDFNFEGRLTKTENEPPRDKLGVFRNTNFATSSAKARGYVTASYQELKNEFSDDKYYIEFEKKAEKKLRQCRER